MPKAGVGSVCTEFSTAKGFQFQSIYAQSRRWKILALFKVFGTESSFNPFMPKAGVGSVNGAEDVRDLIMFQSIYAQSRRWKSFSTFPFASNTAVSIHLCPKQALEVNLYKRSGLGVDCFNPFMPKAGVGSGHGETKSTCLWLFQSIYAQSRRWKGKSY